MLKRPLENFPSEMRSKKPRQVTEDPKDKLRQEIDVMQKKLNDLKSFNSELQTNKKHLTNKSDFQTRLDEIKLGGSEMRSKKLRQVTELRTANK